MKYQIKWIVRILIFLTFFQIGWAEVPEPNQNKIYAKSALVMEGDTGRVLWEKNGYEKLPMASTTKIMTAIIVLENGNLDDVVTISKNAPKAPRVKMYLKEGEQYTVRDLLYALMLKSYNDVAVAIAEHVGGDVETFCKMMTDKAKEIGAENTSYKTPNGLDADGHYTTAYDLALITRYALRNPQFNEIIQTPQWTLKELSGSGKTHTATNANSFLNSYPGACGVKTGFTGLAGYCFVGAANKEGMTLISVALASGWPPQKNYRWSDTKTLLDYGFAAYSFQDILKPEKIGQISIYRGIKPNTTVYFEDELRLPLRKEDEIKKEIHIPKEIPAPVKNGDVVGQLDVFLNGERYQSYPLCIKQSILEVDFEFFLRNIIDQWLEIAL